MHIDGAKAKQIKIPEFNRGTLGYELIVRSNTIINNLGSYNLKNMIKMIQPQLVDFCDISKYFNSCIGKCLYNICKNNIIRVNYKQCFKI